MSERSPHSVPTAAFWTRAKSCDEALADLIESYNSLADRIEDAWAENQRLQEQLELLKDNSPTIGAAYLRLKEQHEVVRQNCLDAEGNYLKVFDENKGNRPFSVEGQPFGGGE